QALLGNPTTGANADSSADIDVVVCTTGEQHLLGALKLPPGLMRQHATSAQPMYLGYQCHDLLKRNLGRYDYYCYMDDDIALLNPLFSQKLEWFNKRAGDEALLQPNRHEIGATRGNYKLYIDGNLTKPEWSERWQNVRDRHEIAAEVLGRPVRFQ